MAAMVCRERIARVAHTPQGLTQTALGTYQLNQVLDILLKAGSYYLQI